MNLHRTLDEAASALALEVGNIDYCNNGIGWQFTFRDETYTMTEPYPEVPQPSDLVASRFCIRALLRGETWKLPSKTPSTEIMVNTNRLPFHVFHRTWWKENSNWLDGLEPHAGEKTTIDYAATEDEARTMCREWQKTFGDPGRLSRKAEFEDC